MASRCNAGISEARSEVHKPFQMSSGLIGLL